MASRRFEKPKPRYPYADPQGAALQSRRAEIRSSPTPMPVRRAVPLQHFKQEGNGNG